MTDIEQLRKEADDVKNALDALKNNVSLSETEKKNESEKLKSQAEAMKQKIQSEIDALADKTDDESKRKKEEAETLLTSFNETMNLYAIILNSSEVQTTDSTTKEKQDEEKSIWWKTKDWVWEQWDDVWSKDKWKEEWWKNLLRTAWFVATWVWAVALTVKWVKKLWNRAFWKKESNKKSSEKDNDKKDEKSEWKTPWRKKFLVWSAIAGGTVIWWVELYKNWNLVKSFFKEKLWLVLSFDESLYTVETEVRNWINKDSNFWNMCGNFEWLTYDENTQEICSFWEKTKINKNKKEIDWMSWVQFASWEELFHAANLVNFAKRNLKWMWENSTPFQINKTTWDIDFSMSEEWKKKFISANWSNFWTEVLWLWWAWIWSLLWLYFLGLKWGLVWWVWAWLAWYTVWSLIDNTSTMRNISSTIAKGANLQKFVGYLNKQNIWWEHKEEYEPDDTTPMSKAFNEVKHEIDDAYWETDYSAIRDLKLDWDESQPSVYKIKSYYQEVKITLEWCSAKKWENIDYSKITKISIWKYEKKSQIEDEESRWDWLNIDFPHTENWLKEAIRVANLTNKIRHDWSKNWAEKYPFAYWKYKSPFGLEIDVPWLWTNYIWWTTILNNSTLKEKYPTLHKDLEKFPSFSSAVWAVSNRSFQSKMHNQALSNSSEWSQYIKFLHQMWCWNKRKKS